MLTWVHVPPAGQGEGNVTAECDTGLSYKPKSLHNLQSQRQGWLSRPRHPLLPIPTQTQKHFLHAQHPSPPQHGYPFGHTSGINTLLPPQPVLCCTDRQHRHLWPSPPRMNTQHSHPVETCLQPQPHRHVYATAHFTDTPPPNLNRTDELTNSETPSMSETLQHLCACTLHRYTLAQSPEPVCACFMA